MEQFRVSVRETEGKQYQSEEKNNIKYVIGAEKFMRCRQWYLK